MTIRVCVYNVNVCFVVFFSLFLFSFEKFHIFLLLLTEKCSNSCWWFYEIEEKIGTNMNKTMSWAKNVELICVNAGPSTHHLFEAYGCSLFTCMLFACQKYRKITLIWANENNAKWNRRRKKPIWKIIHNTKIGS